MSNIVDRIYYEIEGRYDQALASGEVGLLRLRADWLLRHGDTGEIELTAFEREVLERIVASPQADDDYDWLGSTFDDRLDEWAGRRF